MRHVAWRLLRLTSVDSAMTCSSANSLAPETCSRAATSQRTTSLQENLRASTGRQRKAPGDQWNLGAQSGECKPRQQRRFRCTRSTAIFHRWADSRHCRAVRLSDRSFCRAYPRERPVGSTIQGCDVEYAECTFRIAIIHSRFLSPTNSKRKKRCWEWLQLWCSIAIGQKKRIREKEFCRDAGQNSTLASHAVTTCCIL